MSYDWPGALVAVTLIVCGTICIALYMYWMFKGDD